MSHIFEDSPTRGPPAGMRRDILNQKYDHIGACLDSILSRAEKGLEEEGGCWNNVGRGKGNKRGRGNGASSGRGRGADAGAGAKRGKGRDDPSQPSMKEFIPDPRARLAAGGWS